VSAATARERIASDSSAATGSFFYGVHKHSPDLATIPLDAFMLDLHALGPFIHEEMSVWWDVDVGDLLQDAVGLQWFTGEDRSSHRPHSLCRVHALGENGYIYIAVAFSDEPQPHWYVWKDERYWVSGAELWDLSEIFPSYSRVRRR
jgi:hypothetical protein